ncbi:AWPM-19-like protein [Dioscorea alata]|uniref:AWPM-19-like protein n=1 Tax=Dioscorea alata TaxID=55571 RepID=A0ACB7VY27_DIOAL|nr:AWPM-19-like protein [Dioscorea alata]
MRENGSRAFMGPLLFVNLVMYILVLGLAGWSIDKYIDRETHHHLGGNTSTGFLLIFALMAGAVGACSVLTGMLHLRAWRSDSLAGALSSALVSWALTALSCGLVCKQIILGNRGRRLRTLEAFIIILTLTQLMYLMLLYAGVMSTKRSSEFRNYNTEYGVIMTQRDPMDTGTPAATISGV